MKLLGDITKPYVLFWTINLLLMNFAFNFLIALCIVFFSSTNSFSQGACGTESCSVCDVSATITGISGGVIDNALSSITGNTDPGTNATSETPFVITATECGVITIDVELDFNWNQGDQINWIHGISFENSDGWLAAEGVIIPANPGWLFFNEMSGVCSDITYGAGYFWDPPGTNCNDSGNLSSYDGVDCNGAGDCEADNPALIDGDPSDNWGIDCETDCPQFGFSLTFCPTETGITNEVITFVLTEDGETGGWSDSDGCIFTLSFPVVINSAGIQLPDEDIGPICEAECVTINAGTGCDDYIWSNGETSPEITVCPIETTIYSVTVSSTEGCETSGNVTVIVESCCDSNAGIITANPMVLCPGGISTISVMGYQNDLNYTQVLILVNSEGTVIEVVYDNSYDLSSQICETFTLYSYNYLTNGGSVIPFVGLNISNIDCSLECCDLVEVEIIFEDSQSPVFTNPPSDITITCIEDLPSLESLEWTDNCISSGTSSGFENRIFTICVGGTVIYSWIAIDACNNETTHTQTISIEPIPIAEFINPPQDITVNCKEFDEDVSILEYSNNRDGVCNISGTIEGILIGELDACGSELQQIWTYIDDCDRTIEYIQNIEIIPASIPVFQDVPPSFVSINCKKEISPSSLIYTNNQNGICEISGTVLGVITGTQDSCGGELFQTWSTIDGCGDSLIYEQEIEILPAADPVFVDLPKNLTIDCDEEFPAPKILTYDNGISGSCSIQGEVSAVIVEGENMIEYIWTFINECNGNEISHTQEITRPSTPNIEIDPEIITVCKGETFDLNSISVIDLNGEALIIQYFHESGQEIIDLNILVNNNTIITILATNEEGCSDQDFLQIYADELAIASDVEIIKCANNDGFATFDLSEISILVNSSNDYDFEYYYNQSDAELGINEIETEYSSNLPESQLIVKVINDNGCVDFALITFAVNEKTDFELSILCDNNGTSSESEDDFYNVIIYSESNGSSNLTYDVMINNDVYTTFNYSEAEQIQLPADGQVYEITLQDTSESTCFISKTVGPLTPCSDECFIELEIEVLCDDGDTAGINSDDTYSFTFTAKGINNSLTGYYLFIDGIETNIYAYNEEFVKTFAANGQAHQLLFVDVNNNTCSYTFDSQELLPCSGDCQIVGSINNINCYNNNTSNEISDDTFTADVSAIISDGTGSFIIEPGGYTGNSGETISVGPFGISNGNVVLTITDLNIPSCSTTLTLLAPEPCSTCEETVEAGEDGILDCDIVSISLKGTSSIIGEAQWVGPGNQVINAYEAIVDIPGKYYFTVDFGLGCIVTDSLEIHISNDIPVVNAGPDTMLTCNVDTVLLVGSVIGGNINLEYTWYDESGNVLSNSLELEVTEVGNYFFEVKNVENDCVSPKDVVAVSDQTNGPIAVIYADPGEILDCVIELIYITNEVEQNVVYSWMVNNQETTLPNIAIDAPANIILQAVDTITGCSADANLVIESLEEYPIINTVTNGELSCENTEVIINGSASQSGSSISYVWYNENNVVIATDIVEMIVTEPGTYYLELMDSENGCTNIDTIEVEGSFDYPVLSSQDDYILICLENVLTIEVEVEEGDMDFDWTTVDGNIISNTGADSILISQAGEYIVSVIDQNSGCITKDTITVLPADEIEAVELIIYDENCAENRDGEFILGDINGGTGPYTLIFEGIVQTDNKVENLEAGTYEFSVFDSNGCSYESIVDVSVLPPFYLGLEAYITVEYDETYTLTVDAEIPDDEIDQIVWSPSIGLSCDTCLVTDLDGSLAAEQYTATLTDIYGCKNEVSIQIRREEITNVFIPNVISANGDGNNDLFTAYSEDPEAEILSMKIYDRWGEKMFEKQSFLPNIPSDGWNGTFKSMNVMSGVYGYLIEMNLSEGIKTYTGDVTVIR